MTDPEGISRWQRLDGRITTSGQPSEAQLAMLRDIGVTHIVNLGMHTHEKALPDERASAGALGMDYVHMPVDFASPTEADFTRFCETMRNLEGETVHVHCIVNARVSAFFYRYRREILGMSDEEARPDMEAVWRPGGVWAEFIGDDAAKDLPHRYAGPDY
jgi:protein tyrosine phosphatase (PTP) superfamily phosphohydrolase (DUF442 family)